MMPREQFLSWLAEVLEVPEGSLKGDESLPTMDEWGSLAVMSFMALVDENFGVTLSPEVIMKCGTVDDLYKLATSSMSSDR